MLSSGCSEIGTGSSNSPHSATQSRTLCILQSNQRNGRVCGASRQRKFPSIWKSRVTSATSWEGGRIERNHRSTDARRGPSRATRRAARFVAERREGAATRCRPRGESPEMARPWPRIGRSCRPRPRPPARRRPKHPPTARPRYPDSPHASEPLLSKVKSLGWACAECRALGALRKSERPGPRRHQPS